MLSGSAARTFSFHWRAFASFPNFWYASCNFQGQVRTGLGRIDPFAKGSETFHVPRFGVGQLSVH